MAISPSHPSLTPVSSGSLHHHNFCWVATEASLDGTTHLQPRDFVMLIMVPTIRYVNGTTIKA